MNLMMYQIRFLVETYTKIISNIYKLASPGGGIGRHKGLKIPRRQLHAGSSPALGTKLNIFNYLAF